MSIKLGSQLSSLNFYEADPNNVLVYENSITITSTSTFVVPPGTNAVKFTVVGGGQAGVGTTGGAGGGYFEKTFYAPFTGITTSFILTVGAAGGNSTLAYSNSVVIATAYGATAIGAGATVGIGGTSEGGDINTKGSPGGTTPGVGGASGGPFGDSVYNSTYAGRWLYFNESFTNDNVLIYELINAHIAGAGTSFTRASLGDVGNVGEVGGFGGGGPAGVAPSPLPGGSGGFGGGGGRGLLPGTPGSGGTGAFIVEWTSSEVLEV